MGGGLNAFFIAAEMLFTSVLQKQTASLASSQPWLYRQLCVCGGVTQIVLLMAVNMIGYSVGVGGISGFIAKAAGAGTETLWAVAATICILGAGVQVMLGIRDVEAAAQRSMASQCMPAQPVLVSPDSCSENAPCSKCD